LFSFEAKYGTKENDPKKKKTNMAELVAGEENVI
jgi:hypothetical protein